MASRSNLHEIKIRHDVLHDEHGLNQRNAIGPDNRAAPALYPLVVT